MSLKDAFDRTHTATKINDSVVQISTTYFNYFYDFTQRVMMTSSRGAATPFSQLDREVLVMARDKLVELGGKPPELPPEAPAAPAPSSRKFNL